jgi:hypothetical protein
MSQMSSCGVIALFALLWQCSTLAAELPAPTQIRTVLFGNVSVYKPLQAEPTSVALFVSGDGGWNLGVVNMAHSLALAGAVVVCALQGGLPAARN